MMSASSLTTFIAGIQALYPHKNPSLIPVRVSVTLRRSFPCDNRNRFGLSYTTFAFSNLDIKPPMITKQADEFRSTVSLQVTNTGQRAGKEVIQLYISLPPSPTGHVHPQYQLRAFTKTEVLHPGETCTIGLLLDKYSVSYWEAGIEKWRAETGRYDVLIGESSISHQLHGSFIISE